jgi:AP-1 complex subunit gamma-1
MSILDSPYANYLTRQFVLTAITKLASRPNIPQSEQEVIHDVLIRYTTSPELELQQRAVEFSSLFGLGELREGVLERMPPPELKATVMGVGENIILVRSVLCSQRPASVSERKPVGSTKSKEQDLIGSEDLLGSGTDTQQPQQAAQSNQDLLSEIFGSVSVTSPSIPAASAPSPQVSSRQTTVNDILGLFDSPAPRSTASPAPVPPTTTDSLFTSSPVPTQAAPPPKPPAPQLQSYTAYDKHGLKITLTPQTNPAQPGVVVILARFASTNGETFTGLNFQAAVTKVRFHTMCTMHLT